jgi:hypothetical protein
VSIIRVRQLIERGQLPAQRFGRQSAISEKDVKAFKRLPPGKSGQPRRLE